MSTSKKKNVKKNQGQKSVNNINESLKKIESSDEELNKKAEKFEEEKIIKFSENNSGNKTEIKMEIVDKSSKDSNKEGKEVDKKDNKKTAGSNVKKENEKIEETNKNKKKTSSSSKKTNKKKQEVKKIEKGEVKPQNENIEKKEAEDKKIEESKDEVKKELPKDTEESIKRESEKKDLVKAENKEITTTDEKPEYVQEMLKKRKKKRIIIISIIIGILAIIMFSTCFAIFNMNNTKLLKGISVKKIDISNLNKEDAYKRIEEAVNKELLPEIEFYYGEDYKITLKPEQIEFKYDIQNGVEEAYLVGRAGNIVENNYSIIFSNIFGKKIELAYSYNDDLLTQFVDDINSKIPGVVIEPAYYIENDKLIVSKGKDGIHVKRKELKSQIIDLIVKRNILKMNENFKQSIEIPTEEVKASPINMTKIHSEIYCEPKDAYYELEPYKIYPDVDGIDFTILPEEAQKLVDAENKSEYTFDLKISKASKSINDLGKEAFPYTISTFSTKYDASNRNRSTNLEIAAQKINGKVLMPGEEFSFNKIVGKRTVEEGYRDAKIYADGGVVDGLAGGICQISSTLYNAVLLANLEITERRNHSFTTSYVAAGKDATVVWGTTDFRFKNSRSYPIKIEATVSNGIAEFKMHGMQEDVEYEVKIIPVTTRSIPYTTIYEEDPTIPVGHQVVRQAGHAGYKVTTYKELRQNGAVISKEPISNDTYNPMRKIVRVAPGQVPVP